MDTKYQIELAKDALNSYFAKDIVVKDFSQIPVEIRLAFVQKTPAAFIKSRKVGGVEVPYIDHFYAEKALNFVSNFKWGSEKISSEIETVETKTKEGKVTKMYVASVEMKCWLEFPDGSRIERYIASGHNMYENPAITKADALQSAISKAHTKFARQLGIGTNIQDKEEKAYDRVSRHYVDGSVATPDDAGDAEEGEVAQDATNEGEEKIEGVQHDTEAVEKELSEKEKIQEQIFAVFMGRLETANTEYKVEQLKKKVDQNLKQNLMSVTQHDEFVAAATKKLLSLQK